MWRVESGDVAQGAEWSRFANEEMKSLALLTNDVALVALIKRDTFALDCNVPRTIHSTFYFLHSNFHLAFSILNLEFSSSCSDFIVWKPCFHTTPPFDSTRAFAALIQNYDR